MCWGFVLYVFWLFSIYYIFFFSLSSSLDLFFKFNLTFDFFFREGLIILIFFFYTPSIGDRLVFSPSSLWSHSLPPSSFILFCIWGARVGWEEFFSLDNATHDSLFFHHSSLLLIGLSFLITHTHRENNKSHTNHNHHEQKTKSPDHWESKQFSLRESHRKFFVCSC